MVHVLFSPQVPCGCSHWQFPVQSGSWLQTRAQALRASLQILCSLIGQAREDPMRSQQEVPPPPPPPERRA